MALASIAGDNSTAALQFDDRRVAAETLSALRARTHMVAACLYRPDGELFARYSRSNDAVCPPPSETPETRSTAAGLTISRPILLDGGRIGTLTFLYDTGEIVERLKFYAAVVLAVLFGSSLIAFALSSRLRAVIATPIARVAQAAAAVSESADYSVRVEHDSRDELGLLVKTFNEMLGQIQARDTEIHNARTSIETTLNSIGDAVISTDANGRIAFANPVARALLRWPEPDLQGQDVDEAFHIVNEFTREKVASPVRAVLQQGVVMALANHTVLIARDGSEIPIDDSVAPIMHSGNIAGAVLVFRDVTERRRAQKDSAYLAAIVESSEDAIIGKSPDGIIQTWNAGAERLYGYASHEVIGRAMRELLPDDRKHEESDILERLRTGNRLVHFETVRMRRDGTRVDVSLTISPIRDKIGRVVGVSHIARDITLQNKTAEQMRQTQKLEGLGVLAGGIAHDFNNLLTGILGNASLVLDDMAPGSPGRAPLEAVISASERAAQLAQQMLAYSGKGRFVLERLDLAARVRETAPLIRASVPPTVHLQLNLDEHLPLVEADVAQVQQVIMNIIINAAEAIPEGSPGSVTVNVRAEEIAAGGSAELEPGTYVVFEVIDTGTGMDDETKARIFDPFFTTKFTGRGLGLAAVLGIIRGHRGDIDVTTGLGRGTRFRVFLPAMPNACPQTELVSGQPAADLRGEGTVLIVDDEEVVRATAQHALRHYGYHVLLAENGARGLDLFRSEADRILCVILRPYDPCHEREETLARMRSVRPEIPILIQRLQRNAGGAALRGQRPCRFPAKAIQGGTVDRRDPTRLGEA